MKKLVFNLVLLGITILSFGQNKSTDEEALLRAVNHVIENTKRSFINTKTGEIYKTTKGLSIDENIRIESQFNYWQYPNGVIHMAMMDLYEFFEDERFLKYPIANYQFFFDNLDFLQEMYNAGHKGWDFHLFFRMFKLDDCGALGSGLIEILEHDPKPEYKEYIGKTAQLAMHDRYRLADGTWAKRNPYDATVWLDDLFMGVPFLARMGEHTGDRKYFDFAAMQVIQFHRYLYEPRTELYYHNYYHDLGRPGLAHWGRANGWSILAQVGLLEYLPKNHPRRDTLMSIFKQQVIGYSRYQSESGLWHQILDKTDSYLETSCSAMFTYAVAKGVNEGWIDSRYQCIAIQGWEGLKTQINEDGAILNVCEQTPTNDNLVFYYTRPAPYNDFHGTGALIFAGLEILKLKNNQNE